MPRRKIVIPAALILALLVLSTEPPPAEAALRDKVRSNQWYLDFLDIEEAHKISKGAGVKVGVVDSGVFPHIDLRRNLDQGTDLRGGGDGRGTTDQDGHGTGMAGLIAAHGRPNGSGLLGIAPSARIIPIKIYAQENAGSSEIAEGIERAISAKARVINVSFAAGPAIELEDAVAHAAEADALVVAGTGNRPRMLLLGYPAATPGVLAVGAIDSSGKHADISITGDKVEICAPGVDIEIANPGNKYDYVNGTSPATAIVSGAAALVRAKFPDLTAPQVIQRLTATADDIGPPGRDDECGFGVLNIVKALTADVPVGGGPSAGASASASQVAPATSDVAAPKGDEPGVNLLAVAGGLVGLVLVGGLVAVLALRRRQKS